MPITWTHENVSRLFLVTLAVHHIHMDYKQIAAAFGGDASPRAIEEKMKKLRKEAREFGDGSIDFLVNRSRANAANSNGKGGKGGISKSGKNGKGRARPVKYENGRIKWEYDNCEDDSEGEGGLSARGYGDLMECYLLKKENKDTVTINGGMEMTVEMNMGVDMSVDVGMNIDPAITGDISCTPAINGDVNPYYIDPIFGTYTNSDVSGMQMQMLGSGHAHGSDNEAPPHLLEEETSNEELDAGDIGAVMDPMLTNGMSSMTFQAAVTLAPAAADANAHALHLHNGDGDVGMQMQMAWEQNQDLRELNDEFRTAGSHTQSMPEGDVHIVPESQEQVVQVGSPETEAEQTGQTDVGGLESEAVDVDVLDNSASS
ncbi:hypothetical protein TWF696_009314 [Orbilia brochopaga]|uniref:Uncharacterized protein n=1 Tax=Orbilia brochopaga TaxID=3140254 RepID=A0AAV9UIB7_9PEZI